LFPYESLMPRLAEQCCDAGAYLNLAQGCADNGILWCWHGQRPMGAQLFLSVPLRLGMGADGVIPLNALLLCLSVLGAVRAVRLMARPPVNPGQRRWVEALLCVAFLGVHVAFAGAMVRNSLMDLPAGVCALLGIWALSVAALRNKSWLFVASGFAIGVSATIRAFYLYPGLICGIVVALICALRRATWLGGALFLLALSVPLSFQVAFTHAFTGSWSFLDPSSVGAAFQDQLTDTAYGKDTILPSRVFTYDASECFARARGLADSVRKHAWGEAACFVGYKQWFYFGSFTPGGRVYLHDPSERVFSVALLIGNLGALVAGAAWVLMHGRKHPLFVAVFLYLGAIWGEASSLRPEARYAVVVPIAAWVFALAGATELGLRLRKRLA